MIPYADQTETSITIGGTRYETRPQPEGLDCCHGCIFRRKEFKLLVPNFCDSIPCTYSERAHGENVIFVEVTHDSV